MIFGTPVKRSVITAKQLNITKVEVSDDRVGGYPFAGHMAIRRYRCRKYCIW